MTIKSFLLVLNEYRGARFLINNRARHLHSISRGAGSRESQQARDLMGWNIKWIFRRRLLHRQIIDTRHEQAEAEQLPLPIKQRRTDTSRFEHALDQRLGVGDRQLM